MTIIESLQNKTIKNTAKLLTKKERDLTGLFLAEGQHLCQEAAAAGILEQIFALENEPVPADVPVTLCSQSVLNKLSAQKSDARIIGVCHKPVLNLHKQNHLLVLDRIQDPGNVGTLIRTACAFGMDGILLSEGCADLYNPKTIQSSQGALFQIPCEVCDLSIKLPALQSDGMQVLAAALHQDSIACKSLQTPDRYALMIGNEGQGLSQELLALADQTVHIEMKTFESLNAAIAGAILMYRLQMLPQSL